MAVWIIKNQEKHTNFILKHTDRLKEELFISDKE